MKIFRGYFVYDETGTAINHRIWFKVLFNPVLRLFGWVIATQADNGKVLGYTMRKSLDFKPE
jgi:hypothetical protein